MAEKQPTKPSGPTRRQFFADLAPAVPLTAALLSEAANGQYSPAYKALKTDFENEFAKTFNVVVRPAPTRGGAPSYIFASGKAFITKPTGESSWPSRVFILLDPAFKNIVELPAHRHVQFFNEKLQIVKVWNVSKPELDQMDKAVTAAKLPRDRVLVFADNREGIVATPLTVENKLVAWMYGVTSATLEKYQKTGNWREFTTLLKGASQEPGRSYG